MKRLPPATAAVLLALLLGARPARAQSGEADALIARGIDLRRRGNDDAAMESFRRAWDLSHAPRARAQMGLAEQALGRWRDADAHLREALGSSDDPWIDRNRPALVGALATIGRHFGSLDIRADVPGAEVWIEGQRAGVLPLSEPLRLQAGSVVIEVRAPGRFPAVRTVIVPAEASVRESFELVPLPTPAPSPPPVPAPSPAPIVVSTPAPARTAPARSGVGRTLGWVGLGASALLLGGGVVALVVRESAVSHFNGPECLSATADRMQNCPDDYDRGNTMQTLATVGFLAGGALAVTSVVLLVTSPSARRESAPAPRVAVGRGPGDVGVTLGVGF